MIAITILWGTGTAWGDTVYDTPAVTIDGALPYQVDIHWEPASNIPEAVYGSVAGYEVNRCIPTSPHLFQHLVTVPPNVYSYSDNTVTPSHSYMYSIWPIYSGQDQPNIDPVNSSLVTAPASPTGLPNPNVKINPVNDYSPYTPQISIDGAYSSRVDISWAPFTGVSEAVYGTLDYYDIGRSTPDYPNYIHHLGTVSSGVCSYSDNTVVSGDQYIYVVTPEFSAGQQPLINLQGSTVVIMPYPSSSSGSSSSSSSGSTSPSTIEASQILVSEAQPLTVQETEPITTTATIQPVTQQLSQGPQIVVNGQPVNFDVPPEIVNGRTFVPIRSLAYSLGMTEENISWDGATNTVTVMKGDLTIKLSISSNQLIVNGEAREMDVVPYMKNDRTLVPLRFIAEALGLTVEWDEVNQQVTIKQV